MSKATKDFLQFEVIALLVVFLLFLGHPEEWISHIKFFGALSVGITFAILPRWRKNLDDKNES